MRPHPLAVMLAVALIGRTAGADGPTPGYPEEVIQWGVQKGESCEDIALAVYGDARHAHLILRYNRVACTRGAPLKPGLTLVLPAKVTTIPTATLRAFTPSVRARPAGGAWGDATTGMPLATNTSVNTLDDARADIQFVDRTRVFLAENTLVVIFGTASQSMVSKSPPPAVEVEVGELRAALSALRGDPVEVGVPGGGHVTAQSRDTVIDRRGDRTTVAVFDGSARVRNAGQSVDVPKNFGTRFHGAAAPQKPRALPPAPAWLDRPAATVLAAGGPGAFRVGWSPVDRAKAYRVELARDGGFDELLVRQEVPAATTSFQAERMPAGTYFVRVRAIDADDFLGVAADTLRIVVAEVAITEGMARLSGDELAVSPYAVLDLRLPPGGAVALDDHPPSAARAPIDLTTVRPRRIRVVIANTETVVRIRYLPVTASIAIEPHVSETPARVAVALSGATGVDVAGRLRPQLLVERRGAEVAERRALTADPRRADRLVASIERPREVTRLTVVDGAGAVLGSAEVGPGRATGAAPAERRPRLGPTAALFGPSPHLPDWWAPTAPTMAAASFALEQDFAGSVPNGQGRVLVSGAFGPVGLEGSFFTDDFRTASASHESVWVGTRLRMVDERRVEAGLAVRLGVPLDDLGGPLEAGVGLGVGGAAGPITWLADVFFDVDEGEAAYPYLPSLIGGVATDLVPWLRGYATLDVFAATIAGEPRPGGGLTIGLEAGQVVFGGIAGRASPFPPPLGGVIGTLTVGVRTEP